jgi:tryptophan synthase beta chain
MSEEMNDGAAATLTPDERFGGYGGRFVPETLISALDELARVYRAAADDPSFHQEMEALWRDYVGGPTPLYRAAG